MSISLPLQTPRLLAAACLALVLAACGGGSAVVVLGGGGGGEPKPINASTPGMAVTKVRASGTGWVALAETLLPVADVVKPDRKLLVADNGSGTPATYTAPAGWSLIDFAVHPSRQVTVVLANDTTVALARLDAQGKQLHRADFSDPLAIADPYYGDPLYIRKPGSMVPYSTRDAARLGVIGEDAALVLRTGRNAIVAYRLRYAAATGFTQAWRTLVEPGALIGNVGITSGTFDPFGGLDSQWRLHMDVDAAGRIAVGAGTYRTELAEAHAAHFGESFNEALISTVLVTQIEANGQRTGTAVVDTRERAELHALAWVGAAVAVGGRVLTARRDDGGGWDGFVGLAQPATRKAVGVAKVDVDRGDLVSHIAALPNGQMLAAGTTGYTQNPNGASISEGAAPLLAHLDAQGRVVRRIALAAGLRHNQLRSLSPIKGNWLLGGLENGPGTHSADANPGLLKADGYVREMAVPAN